MPVLLVFLHGDAEKEHKTPIPTAVQACVELDAGPIVEVLWQDEENKVHPHAAMTWKGFTVDKLVAKEVRVTFVKAVGSQPCLYHCLHLGDQYGAARASSAVEYHCQTVCGFRSMEEDRSVQIIYFCGDISEVNVH